MECKASVVLRERNRRLLEWLIGPLGPLNGNAHVHLTDKAFHLVSKMTDLLGDEATVATSSRPAREGRVRATAVTLYREGPATFGRESWEQLLGSFNDLMRAKNLVDARVSAKALSLRIDDLRRAHPRSEAGDILGHLREDRPHADSALVHLLDKSRGGTVLDPLVPAVAGAVAYWGQRGQLISIVHDEQRALTAERIRQLAVMCSRKATNSHISGAGRLAGIRFVDSRSDPRVQVADFLAGAARKIASDELNGRGNPQLSASLRPYVDTCSIWGDDRSWARLAPPASDLS